MSDFRTLQYESLGSITTKIGSGATPRGGKESYKTDGISLIRSMNVYDFNFNWKELALIDESQANKLKNVVVKKNDILLNITGASVCRCCIVPTDVLPARVNQHVAIVRLNPQLADPQFVLNTINSFSFKQALFNVAMTGATREALTKDDIARFKLPLPPLPVQKKIAAVLSAYDDLIENNKRRIAILEKMAEEIYREWFVRMRFPGQESTKFEKGLPKTWKIEKADSVFDVVKGKSYTSSEISDVSGDRPFVTLKSFNRGGGYRNDGIKFYSGKYNDKQLVSQNDIVIAVTDMTQNREVVGRAARIPNIGETKAVISLDAVKIVPKGIPNLFLYSHLRWSGFGELLKDFANGANVLHLSPGVIPQQKLLVPDSGLTERYEEIVAPIFAKVDLLFDANSILTRTRQILLPILISGKLSVEDLNIQFPSSMIEEEQSEPEAAYA